MTSSFAATRSRPKVMFVDVWRKGLRMFVPLAERLATHGVDCLLVHRETWGYDYGQGRPPQDEVASGLRCRDMSFYRTRFFYDVFRRERPDVILTLNFGLIDDRAVILSARALGIKTCYLMHGMLPTGDALGEVVEGSRTAMSRKVWGRAGKHIAYSLPNYFYGGARLNGWFPLTLSPYRLIWDTYADPARYCLKPPPSAELRCDLALVWAKVYKEQFVSAQGYEPDRVKIVGNPPLDGAFALRQHPPTQKECRAFVRSVGTDADRPLVVYLETPFALQGTFGWTDAGYMAHLHEVADIVKNAGRSLVVKLHPRTNARPIREAFRGDDRVIVLERTDLNKLAWCSECAIGFISTTISTFVCLDRPVFVPRWGISEAVLDHYVREGAAEGCGSPADLRDAIMHARKRLERRQEAIASFIDRHITFEDGRSQERIASAVLDLVRP